MSVVIRRDSDHLYYAGTADRTPIWTEKKDNAAVFRSPNDAKARMDGLEKIGVGKVLAFGAIAGEGVDATG